MTVCITHYYVHGTDPWQNIMLLERLHLCGDSPEKLIQRIYPYPYFEAQLWSRPEAE